MSPGSPKKKQRTKSTFIKNENRLEVPILKQ